MTTRRLLWGMAWRGMIFGSEFGAVFGFLYGASLMILIMISGYIFPSSPTPRISGEQIELDVGVFLIFVSLFGFAGFVIGISSGFVLGLIGGTLHGVVTWVFFCPLRSREQYYRLTQMLGGLHGSLGIGICFFLISNIANTPDSSWLGGSFIFASALISGLCGILVSRRIVHWYERESAKGIGQNVASN